jgi:hypothetical protein
MHFPIDSRIVLFADYKGTENSDMQSR